MSKYYDDLYEREFKDLTIHELQTRKALEELNNIIKAQLGITKETPKTIDDVLNEIKTNIDESFDPDELPRCFPAFLEWCEAVRPDWFKLLSIPKYRDIINRYFQRERIKCYLESYDGELHEKLRDMASNKKVIVINRVIPKEHFFKFLCMAKWLPSQHEDINFTVRHGKDKIVITGHIVSETEDEITIDTTEGTYIVE